MAGSFRLTKSKFITARFRWLVVGIFLLVVTALLISSNQPNTVYDRTQPARDARLAVTQINQMLFSYASDHKGIYPTGKNSTEVFQKLIDEQYCNDPGIFCGESLKVPGKIKASSNALTPENVTWDVTVPLDAHSDDLLPVVFSTGYRVNYVTGGSAVPHFSSSEKRLSGIAVCYHGNNAAWLKSDGQSDGVVTNFISQAFEPNGKKYVQLTPEGP